MRGIHQTGVPRFRHFVCVAVWMQAIWANAPKTKMPTKQEIDQIKNRAIGDAVVAPFAFISGTIPAKAERLINPGGAMNHSTAIAMIIVLIVFILRFLLPFRLGGLRRPLECSRLSRYSQRPSCSCCSRSRGRQLPGRICLS